MITERNPAKLTIEDIRALVRYCDSQYENYWRPPARDDLTLAQILALYHAVSDAGYDSLEGWFEEERQKALATYNHVLNNY